MMILAYALVDLALMHPAASANEVITRGRAGIPTQSAKVWSPELIGGVWNWRLTKYKYLDSAYKFNDQTLLLLSTDVRDSTDNVLWNPLTGTGQHFDHNEYIRFWSSHKNDRVPTWSHPTPLSEGQTLRSIPAPGQMPFCHTISFSYYALLDSRDAVIKTFYIIRTLRQPKKIAYWTCPEADTRREHHMKIDLLMDFYFAADLSDGTLLFVCLDNSEGLLIIRLDQNLEQRTFLGGRVYVVDARAINDGLRPAGNDFDMYNTFKMEFTKRIPAAKAPP